MILISLQDRLDNEFVQAAGGTDDGVHYIVKLIFTKLKETVETAKAELVSALYSLDIGPTIGPNSTEFKVNRGTLFKK